MSAQGIVILLIVFVVFSAFAISIAKQWSRNNNSQEVSVKARVLKIRDDGWFQKSSGTYRFDVTGSCRITFEIIESGQCQDLNVSMGELDVISEGDIGTLTMQGTRYISFKKQVLEDL